MSVHHIGRYQILGQLGEGGMATVLHGHDPRFKRDVAIKVLPREMLFKPIFRERFEREAQTIAALEHHAIVPVYDYGEEDGQPYLVMRHMVGGSLADRLPQGGMSLIEAVTVIDRVASALDKAHGRGIVHRDIKPSNILFDEEGHAYLSDFGIVKLTEATSQLTGGGMVGTPAYMAPEMTEANGITPLIDIYALGVTVYQMLSGRLPYEAETPQGMFMAHVARPIPDIRGVRADLPDDIQALIEGAMAKDPVDRYPSAGELAAGLRHIAATPAIRVRAPLAEMSSPAPGYTPTVEIEGTVPGIHEVYDRNMEPIPPPPPPIRPERVKPDKARKPVARQTFGWRWIGAAAAIAVGVLAIWAVSNALRPVDVPTVGKPIQITDSGGDNLMGSYTAGGLLAFVSTRGGDEDIYVLDADGSVVQVTRNNASDADPSYTAGGLLAFASNRDGDFDIYVLDTGGTIIQVTNSAGDDVNPTYRADGVLVFASNRDGDFDIYGLTQAGETIQITNNPGNETDPVYAPDNRLAFVSDRDGDAEIYVLGTDGTTEQITRNRNSDLDPTFSADGSQLFYASDRGGNFNIYAADKDGAESRVTKDRIDERYPVMRPDQTVLVYTLLLNGGSEIFGIELNQ